MVGAGNQDPSRTRPRKTPDRRNPRLRLACLRCQRRKIKCDGETPACKNCRNAGATCSDGESARLPRAYIDGLKHRISWLESIVSSRCPDVDLAQGPSAIETDQNDGVDNEGNTFVDDSTQSVFRSPDTSLQQAAPPVEHPDDADQTAVRSGPGQAANGANALSHEIGLVSLGTNQDPRYIGPSSGYFLARVMLNSASRSSELSNRASRDLPFPTQLVEAVQGPLPLPPREMARQLCDAYFEMIHPQYPILHQPTFLNMIDQVYSQDAPDPIVRFQAYMVLAIGASILSGRLKARIPGESYCLSALQGFNDLNVENSLQGMQCLLLLLIFTIHNPYMRLNVWYLNYHCLASLLDMGLQRNISARASGISLLEQEMRTRIFWVTLTMDRTIATMMGRPVGIRDEACELRMPQGLSDIELAFPDQGSMMPPGSSGPKMVFAMHSFEATKLNSEIKYVANSINRNPPSYAYPSIIDINDWQKTMLGKIDRWGSEIPRTSNDVNHIYLTLTFQLRYHGLKMLLLRPSPAIPKPAPDALIKCHESACESIRIFDELYRKNLLVHTWMTFHSLVLSTITMLYCIKVVPTIAQRTKLDALMGDMSVSLSILSATGEHWSGAKRSRDILDQLGRSTIRWLQESNMDRVRTPAQHARSDNTRIATPRISSNNAFNFDDASTLVGPNTAHSNGDPNMMVADANFDMSGLTPHPFDDFIIDDSFSNYFGATESINVDNIVRDLFQDFIPINTTF